ncbi:DUF504 domain-containing protein [Methanoregula sp.]|jgi:uncharacterized protein|uniref:DUF504 domain-containing protein n=1 Tax=Methanoregula sp. TaxID=2052170 RepID=UPI003C26BAF9
MLTSHELLLQYWHDPRYVFADVMVCYVDRGALGDRSCVNGSAIRVLESYYFEIGSGEITKYIPYHRIQKITYAGEPVWERQGR